ncbi:MAG: amino acid ABC transporter substrate-binding protein [Clostridia bacterium]|nr:amino acid ABC transporter substrate-binding protein [Clostridia bacterium]
MSKKYKGIFILLLVVGLAVFAAGCGGQTEAPPAENQQSQAESSGGNEQQKEVNALEAIKERGVLVAGLDDSFAPMGFRDENNELVGFDIDMGAEIAKRMGIEIEWQPTDWDGVISALQTKRFDVIISGMTITPERAEQVNFTEPYVVAGVVALVKAGNDSVKTADDLAGKVVGIQGGSSGENVVEQLEGLKEVKRYKQFPECLSDLEIGRIDVGIVDVTVAAHFLALRPGVFEIATPLNEEFFAIATRKEDTALLDELNRIIAEMKADGTLYDISMKWFGENVVPE